MQKRGSRGLVGRRLRTGPPMESAHLVMARIENVPHPGKVIRPKLQWLRPDPFNTETLFSI